MTKLAIVATAALLVGLIAAPPATAAIGDDDEDPDLCKMAGGRKVCAGVAEGNCALHLSAGIGGCWLRL